MGESDMISYMPNKQGASNKGAECVEFFHLSHEKERSGWILFSFVMWKNSGQGGFFFQK